MIATLLPLLLTTLGQIVPALGGSTAIGTVLGTLTEVAPLVIKEANDLTPMVKNIISALSEHPDTTADQLAALQALDALSDADFEDAAKPQPGDPDYVDPSSTT